MRVCTSYEDTTSLDLNIQEKQKYKLNAPFSAGTIRVRDEEFLGYTTVAI